MGETQNLTAGKCHPSNDAEGGETVKDCELDAMRETENARAWDAQNATDANVERSLETIGKVLSMVEDIEILLVSAADDLDGAPDADRIMSIQMDFERLECDLRQQTKRMEA